jgi:hypothetical protein
MIGHVRDQKSKKASGSFLGYGVDGDEDLDVDRFMAELQDLPREYLIMSTHTTAFLLINNQPIQEPTTAVASKSTEIGQSAIRQVGSLHLQGSWLIHKICTSIKRTTCRACR